jgi:hypothetical protein
MRCGLDGEATMLALQARRQRAFGVPHHLPICPSGQAPPHPSRK